MLVSRVVAIALTAVIGHGLGYLGKRMVIVFTSLQLIVPRVQVHEPSFMRGDDDGFHIST